MKQKTKFRNVTFLLAVCASITVACICVLLIAEDYHSAQSKFDAHVREAQGWEAFRQTNPDYFKANEEEASNSKKNLDEAKSNFWVKLPKQELVGLFALGGVSSALAGYLAVWTVALLCRTCVRTLIRGLAFYIGGSRTRGALSNS